MACSHRRACGSRCSSRRGPPQSTSPKRAAPATSAPDTAVHGSPALPWQTDASVVIRSRRDRQPAYCRTALMAASTPATCVYPAGHRSYRQASNSRERGRRRCCGCPLKRRCCTAGTQPTRALRLLPPNPLILTVHLCPRVRSCGNHCAATSPRVSPVNVCGQVVVFRSQKIVAKNVCDGGTLVLERVCGPAAVPGAVSRDQGRRGALRVAR